MFRRKLGPAKEGAKGRLPDHAYIGSVQDTLRFYIVHARVMAAANYAEAKKAIARNRIITIFLLILSFLITVAPTTPLFQALSGWFGSFVTLLGALTVSLAAIQYALDLEGRASAHRTAAAEFSRLRREMELLASESIEGEALRRALSKDMDGLSLCSSLAPMVSEKLVMKYFQVYLPERQAQAATVLTLDAKPR